MSQGKRQRRGIIYLIHCIPENKDYVGQTRRSFKKRWHEHCHAVEKYGQRLAEGKRTSLSSIDEKINELGPDAFETSILERPLIEDLNKRERYWIAELGTRDPHGYNKTDGGGANGRIELTDKDQQNIIALYLSGVSALKIANKYNCCSQYVYDFLRSHDIEIRSHDEILDMKRKNAYYRLDPQTREVLEEYTSFALIGKWAQDNNLTTVSYASTAGMATRYAMLFDTKMYGYKWDSSWTEEEKEEYRQKFKASSKKNKKQKERIRTSDVPSREVLKKQLQSMSRKEIRDVYNISCGCLDNWRSVYCLDTKGNDTEGWESAPKHYNRNERPISANCPDKEELIESFAYPTLRAAAAVFSVCIETYLSWLKKMGLPHTRADIDRYRQENGISIKEECVVKPARSSRNPKRTPFVHDSGKMPSKEELIEKLRCGNFRSISEEYGVTDNAVRKWCKKLNLPDSSSILRSIPDDQWEYVLSNWLNVADEYANKKRRIFKAIDEDKAKMVSMYENGETVKAIAQHFACDVSIVSKALKEQGVEIVLRPNARAVYCPEFDIETESIGAMAQHLLDLGKTSSNKSGVETMIRRVASGQRAAYLGVTFKYVDK